MGQNVNPQNKNRQRRANKKQKPSLPSRIFKIWINCMLVALVCLMLLIIVRVVIPVAGMYKEATDMVSQSDESTFRSEQTSIVYDANDKEIKKLKGEKDVYYLDFENIPDAAKLAIISVEDKSFTTHKGVDLEGIARAIIALVMNKGRATIGGSTITQQLARNVFLNYEKTYSRKIEEIFIAIALERKYTKAQILEFYLNNVYFANGYYGIQAASKAYFRKDANKLTIAQIAFLCSIPNSPTRYDPYEHKDSALSRQEKILRNMYKDGYISKDQLERSLNEKIKVLPKKVTQSNDYAETFILKCATESLMKMQGFEFKTQFSKKSEKKAYDEEYDELYSSCRQSLYTAGYRIYTSIDMVQQDQLQKSVSSQLSQFSEKTDDGIYKVQGAAVCIDNATGRVTAIVGGREEDQEGYGLNRAYQSYRQPGSAIKPVLVFAPALEQGYSPDSTVDDSRMTGKDKVNNAGNVYMGSVSLSRAVQKSSNVATYRLYKELGPENCLEYLERMNFKGLEEADYQYDTTCLGGFTKGTTAVEMAAAYATLCNDGIYRNPTCIVRITDTEGNILVPDEQIGKQIYSSNAAHMMTEVLESCVNVKSATASGCKLSVDMPAACKTGTTTDYVDGWLCGYTPYYTTAVWVGMDLYKSVDDLKGNTYPAYIWKNYMDKIHQGLTRRDFDESMEDEDDDTEKTTKEKTEATSEETDEEDKKDKEDTPYWEDEDDDSYDDEKEDEDDDSNDNQWQNQNDSGGQNEDSNNSQNEEENNNQNDDQTQDQDENEEHNNQENEEGTEL